MQMVSRNIIPTLFFLTCTLGYSQTTNRFLLDCKSELLKPGRTQKPLNFSSSANVITQNYFLIQPQLGKKPMFCRMEDNLHKRFNIWIVMRAGGDEEYRKLIDEREKIPSGKIP
jgi:hypothetical protein